MVARKVWRDAEGRTRSERPLGMGPNQASMPLIVEITDPVAGFKYTLDTQNKVAHRQAMPSRGVLGGTVGSSAMLRGGIYNGPAPPAAIVGGGGGGGSRARSQGATSPPPV